MKKSIKTITTVIMILCIAPWVTGQSQSQGQHKNHQNCNTGYQVSRTIELEDSSDTEEIKLEVSENMKALSIGINSTIDAGSLTMEIYDPKGNKQGNFSVESSTSSSSKGKRKELVCGQLNKAIENPMKGDWTIKLKPKNVTGKINIHSHQAQ